MHVSSLKSCVRSDVPLIKFIFEISHQFFRAKLVPSVEVHVAASSSPSSFTRTLSGH